MCRVIDHIRIVWGVSIPKRCIPSFKASISAQIANENTDDAAQGLSQFAEVGTFAYFKGDEPLSLFGETYTLGPVKSLSVPIKLAHWSETKTLLDEGFRRTSKR